MKRIQCHRHGGLEELRLRAAIGRTMPADAIAALVELEVNHQPKGKLIIEPAGGAAS